MPDADYPAELSAIQTILTTLTQFDDATRSRILRTVSTFFGESPRLEVPRDEPGDSGKARLSFTEDRSVSPKDFMAEKRPETDIERIACLAYYLTHYRNTPHFKTLDLSKLNTEAAQPKFANAAYTANNAVKAGILVQANKGQRQISTTGEQYVLALPDRSAARTQLASARKKRRGRKAKAPSGNS